MFDPQQARRRQSDNQQLDGEVIEIMKGGRHAWAGGGTTSVGGKAH